MQISYSNLLAAQTQTLRKPQTAPAAAEDGFAPLLFKESQTSTTVATTTVAAAATTTAQPSPAVSALESATGSARPQRPGGLIDIKV